MKLKLCGLIKKIKKLCYDLSGTQQAKIINAFHKSVILYHLGPAIAAKELNINDAYSIIKTTERKIRNTPAWVSFEAVQAIIPCESTLSWVITAVWKMISKLRSNDQIKHEIGIHYNSWNSNSKITYWALWIPRKFINMEQFAKLSENWYFRLIMQLNRDIFHEFDNDPKQYYLWSCGKIWNIRHRLVWNSIPANKARLFSIYGHEMYFDEEGFLLNKYLETVIWIQTEIKKLIKIRKEEVTHQMKEHHQQIRISTADTKERIRIKFDMVARCKNIDLPLEGEELEFFTNIWINIEKPVNNLEIDLQIPNTSKDHKFEYFSKPEKQIKEIITKKVSDTILSNDMESFINYLRMF